MLFGGCWKCSSLLCAISVAGDDREIVRRHITVCHDICHSAVMWEDQGREIQSYFDLGIRIGKVQVSSAIEMRWDEIDAAERTEAIEQLSEFAEDRYLHQTTIRSGPAGSVRLFEDLPRLLETGSAGQAGLTDAERSKFCQGTWRVHFHVPIFAEKIRHLRTTQPEIVTCSETSDEHGYRGGEIHRPLGSGNVCVERASRIVNFDRSCHRYRRRVALVRTAAIDIQFLERYAWKSRIGNRNT